MKPEQIAKLERLLAATKEETTDVNFYSRHIDLSNALKALAPELIATAKEVERLKAERDELVNAAITVFNGYNVPTPNWTALKEAIAKVQK